MSPPAGARRRGNRLLQAIISRPFRTRIFLAWLVAANLLVFGQSLQFDFLAWDDHEFVLPHLQRFRGLTAESLWWALINQENGWRTPLPYISLFLDAQLYGVSPAGLHFTNLLIHTSSTILLFSALRRMTGRPTPALVAATIFAIHPLHVEPVVWVTGRWELLCGFFWIAGVWCYAQYCRGLRRHWYLATIAIYACALLSKPMALTFPFALLLLDYWPLERFGVRPAASWSARFQPARASRLLLEKTPLFGLMAAALAVSWAAKSSYLNSRGMLHFSGPEKLANAVQTYAIYLAKAVWPSDLSFFYPHPVLTGGVQPAATLLAAVVLAAVTAATLLLGGRQKYLLVGWLWYLGVFVPAIGLMQVDHHARADRYTYLPLIGIAIAAAWGATAWLARWRSPQWMILGGSLAVLMLVAHQQASHWRSDEALFSHGVAVNPANYKALSNLGNVYARRGDLPRALGYYERSRAACPRDRATVNNLAVARYQCREMEAVCRLLSPWESAPDAFPARYLLPLALVELDQSSRAVAVAREMVRLDPDHVHCRAALAVALVAAGCLDEGRRQLRRVLDEQPNHPRCAALMQSLLPCSDSDSQEPLE